MWPQWPNNNDIAHLQAKMLPWTWLWSQSTKWLLNYNICKYQRAPTTPVGMPMGPWWVNDHDIEHLQDNTVPINLIWGEFVEWFLSYNCRTAHLQVKVIPMNLIWSESNEWLHGLGRTARWPDKQTNQETDNDNSKVPPFALKKAGDKDP